MYDAAVIGGGISGLAAAYELQKSGYKVVVIERQVRVGGKAHTGNLNGFLMEYGASSINGASIRASAFSTELGLDGERCQLGPDVRKRYLIKNGRLNGIAKHPFGFLTSSYLSLPSRLRLLTEIFRSAGPDNEETVAEFCTRRFGREFSARIIDPLIGGLFAARATELSLSAVFPKLQSFEKQYGSVTMGAIRRRMEGNKMPARLLYSWQRGIGALPNALAGQLGSNIKTGITVRGIDALRQGYRLKFAGGGSLDARSVIVATQPHVTADLLQSLDLEAAEAAAEIHAPPITVIFMGFRREDVDHPLDGIGSLSPESEKRTLSGILFPTTMFPGRAPEGCVSLSGYIAGARSPDLVKLPLEDQAALAREEFRHLLGVRGEPLVTRVHHWHRGLPQARIGHGRLISKFSELESRRPGMFVTGNYFSSPSIANCVETARETVARVAQFLGAQENTSRENETGGVRFTASGTGQK